MLAENAVKHNSFTKDNQLVIEILEDERRTADLIARLIKQYDNSFTVLGVIDSVEKGVECFIHSTELPDNHEVVVSRERVQRFKEWLNK